MMHMTRVLVWVCCVLYNYIQLPCTLADVGYFWHVTDFHYDFSYHDGQLSCNKAELPANLGQFGDFWCDAPWKLVNNSIYAMASIKPDVDFLLWTGDTILHASDDHLNYSINAEILDDVTDTLKAAFPNTPTYAAFGNHDYYPNNQFPPHNNQLYNDTLVRWRDWINDPTQDVNFLKGAYYTVKTAHGLRIIALNTNLYYTSNKVTTNLVDPGEQFDWLNKTLRNAKVNNEKVLITAHIPPGVHTPNSLIWMYEHYNDKLLQILQPYVETIVGMHFGHDHSDGFKVLLDDAGEQSAPLFIAPSVTPWRYIIPNQIGPAHNPGVRLVKYDRQTGRHLDLHQYYLDLEKANRDGVAKWEVEYKAGLDYGLSDLTPEQLLCLAEKMLNSTQSQFINYWKFYTVTPPSSLLEQCDATCHASIICGFTHFHMPDFQTCKANMLNGTAPTFSTVDCSSSDEPTDGCVSVWQLNSSSLTLILFAIIVNMRW